MGISDNHDRVKGSLKCQGAPLSDGSSELDDLLHDRNLSFDSLVEESLLDSREREEMYTPRVRELFEGIIVKVRLEQTIDMLCDEGCEGRQCPDEGEENLEQSVHRSSSVLHPKACAALQPLAVKSDVPVRQVVNDTQ